MMNTATNALVACLPMPSAATPRAYIRFAYCQAVLMKHWDIECNHGCHDEIVESNRSSQWYAIGPIDPIKAILIKNE
ncbi:MAG: hypothetical protein NTY41_05945 [Proteobacteria bacterium]|nr:hypothetical protein [Pseudomonadota bacterium]